MNPLGWTREHQVALLLAVAIGSGIGIAFAYMAAVSVGDTYSFSLWIINNMPFYRGWKSPINPSALGWGIFGGGIGAAIIYIKRFTAKPD